MIPKSTKKNTDHFFESDSKISEQKTRDKPLSYKYMGFALDG